MCVLNRRSPLPLIASCSSPAEGIHDDDDDDDWPRQPVQQSSQLLDFSEDETPPPDEVAAVNVEQLERELELDIENIHLEDNLDQPDVNLLDDEALLAD